MGSGLEGSDHERHVSGAARIHATEVAGAWRIPIAARRAAVDAGPLVARAAADANATQRAAALAQQLLTRYGVVTREAPGAENIIGGFSAVYPVLKAMEEKGRVRRGYFVAGLGATQFASGGALDLLRSLRDEPEEPETVVIAATDPANPYGTIVKWPREGLTRSVGASVILVNGALSAYVSRGEKQLVAFLPDDEPSRTSRRARGRDGTGVDRQLRPQARVPHLRGQR